MAAFSGTPVSGLAPLTVNFTDQSTGIITSWAWDFGDTQNSTHKNTENKYVAGGTYTVSLTARSASGSDTSVQSNLISVPEPTALLQLASGCVGLWALSARRHRRQS